MTKVAAGALTDAALDWAVAKCEGILDPVHGEPQPRVVFYSDQWNRYMRLNPPPQVYYSDRYEPSTDWAQGGPIIERERLCLDTDSTGVWLAWTKQNYKDEPRHMVSGPTPLIAAMRCYVASKLGETVEAPEELVCPNT